MRFVIIVLTAGAVFAAQPILYNRGAVNAASLAPAGLPNAPIALGSIFTVFGENLGPAQAQAATNFPLSSTLAGVSLSVTQNGVVTQAFPTFISAGQVNAVMPSTVTGGIATLRLSYLQVKSNAITVQIANSSPLCRLAWTIEAKHHCRLRELRESASTFLTRGYPLRSVTPLIG
jgi:uncharacterized protein (TIGR03437 family)